ncbi:DUF192 domain-containing protein [Candidatus Parcubacteria bacterium]|nr:DUF192 domain-containing protein [Candidatus Parcubacteria bacterium]
MMKFILFSLALLFSNNHGQDPANFFKASFKDNSIITQMVQDFSIPEILEADIGNKHFNLLQAKTLNQKKIGLSGRESLPKDFGMIFLYDKKSVRQFWMQGMNFPLDFVWIDGDKIIQINENISIQNLPPPETIESQYPADKVLELNAGTCKESNIKVGDSIRFIYD